MNAADFRVRAGKWRELAATFRRDGKPDEARTAEFWANVRDDAAHLLDLDPTADIELDVLADARDDRPRRTDVVPLHVVDDGWRDLGTIVRGEEAAVSPGVVYRDDGVGLFYPGALHDLYSEPGGGKTFLTLHGGAEAVRAGGAFAVLDYEGVAQVFVARLRALGLDDCVIADPERVSYHNLPGRTGPAEVAALLERFTRMRITFLAIDAMLPALVRNGLDDNSNSDLAKFYDEVTTPLLATGASIVTVDHVSRAPTSRGARGAGAKLQLVAVSYEAKLVRAFSRTRAGHFRLRCAKDRYGTFGIGETVAEVHIIPEDDGRIVDVDVRAPGTGDVDLKPTHYMQRLSIALERHQAAGEDPPGSVDLLDMIPGKTDYKRRALAGLLEDGYVERFKEGRHQRHRSIKPYREA